MIDALADAAKAGVVVVRSIARRERDRPPQHRGERRQARVRRRDGPQPAEGARPPAPRAHEDERRQADPEVLRRVLTLNEGATA